MWPWLFGLATSAVTLMTWATLGIGANFGIPPALTIPGLLWLMTLGLPTSIGVVLAAALWGRIEPLTGLYGFLALAVVLGLTLQVAVAAWLGHRVAAAKASGRPWRLGRGLAAAAATALVILTALGLAYRTPAPLTDVVDGHAHLFGDEGWPPVHKQTCGLSSAQKANHSYALLRRLLRLPSTGDLNELYVQALVAQAHEAREALGSFRVVLLAQDCRYSEGGEPDWANSSVYVPNEHLFRVVARHPDLFIPCPSINPQRKDWEAELDYCLAQGARVLKIHPPTQAVNPADSKFRAFYRKCAARGMTVMVHTGTEHSAPIASQTLGDPRLLELALEEGCTVIAAHSGTRAFFNSPAEDHFADFVTLTGKHPRLYGDTAVLGSLFRWRCVPEVVQTRVVHARMIHASDWPFPSNAFVSWHRLHPFTVIRLMAERNLFLRDLRLKQALGLSPDTFARARPTGSAPRPAFDPSAGGSAGPSRRGSGRAVCHPDPGCPGKARVRSWRRRSSETWGRR